MTLSRRTLLGALAAGGAGSLTGLNTAALLGDRETLASELTTGIVDIRVAYWAGVGTGSPDLTAPDSVSDGTDVTAAVEDVEPGAVTRDLFRVRLPQDGDAPNNPARVWLRTTCPAATYLAEALQVELSYSDESATPGTTIVSGSLREVADALRGGVALGDGPATGGEGCLVDELFVLAEYELSGYVGSEAVSLPLEFRAIQCRNTDASLNPFGTATSEPCLPGYSCTYCWAVGKVELEDGEQLEAGDTRSFDYGLDGYAIEVTAVDGDGGVAFTLVRDDGLPALPLCRVEVKGGPDDSRYCRHEGAYGTATSVLDGATDGLVYTPLNPNSATNHGISYIIVAVCAPVASGGGPPADLVQRARSVTDSSGSGNCDGGHQ